MPGVLLRRQDPDPICSAASAGPSARPGHLGLRGVSPGCSWGQNHVLLAGHICATSRPAGFVYYFVRAISGVRPVFCCLLFNKLFSYPRLPVSSKDPCRRLWLWYGTTVHSNQAAIWPKSTSRSSCLCSRRRRTAEGPGVAHKDWRTLSSSHRPLLICLCSLVLTTCFSVSVFCNTVSSRKNTPRKSSNSLDHTVRVTCLELT